LRPSIGGAVAHADFYGNIGGGLKRRCGIGTFVFRRIAIARLPAHFRPHSKRV